MYQKNEIFELILFFQKTKNCIMLSWPFPMESGHYKYKVMI